MKTVCIYHSVDCDGWMSAAIVQHWFVTNNKSYSICDVSSQKELIAKEKVSYRHGIIDFSSNEKANTLDFIGYNYGQPIPDLSGYDKVIMCDISFPKEIMLELANRLDGNFIWIDHHQRTVDEICDYLKEYNAKDVNGLVTREGIIYAACELTWMFFMQNVKEHVVEATGIPMPEIVRLLGVYDSFRHKNTDEEKFVLEFQYGARMYINNYESAYRMLSKTLYERENSLGATTLNMIQSSGHDIYRFLCKDAQQSYKNGFEIIFWNKNQISGEPDRWYFICINKERFNPINFGIDYHKDGYEGCACFHRTSDGKWAFSLYNDNGLVDCSVIAKQFGGGGHRGSAGFVLNDEQFFSLIKNKYA